MDDFGKMPLLADQSVNRLIEHHRKSLPTAANHPSRDQKLIVKFENRKSEFNGLVLGDSPPCMDKNTCGADIPDNFPERPFLDGVFRNDKRRPTGKSAVIPIRWTIHWLCATIL
jgi:hypothetical protein